MTNEKHQPEILVPAAVPPSAPAQGKRFFSGWRARLLIWVVVLGGIMFLLTFWQRGLIYHPERVPAIAARMGHPQMRVEDVTLTAHDGLVLHGWHVWPFDRAKDESGPVVVYFPGNAGNRAGREVQLELLSRLGCHVFLFDYRGYGDNPGKPTEQDLALDAQSAWKRVKEILPGKRMFIYGESLGGGTAVRLASECCEKGEEPAGLIVQSSFSSLVDAGKHHFPWLPVNWLLIDRFPSIQRIPKVTCPILVMHGNRDTIVPFAQGWRLFEAAPAKSRSGVEKKFVELACDHNDVYDTPGPVRKGLEGFLK